MRDRNLQSVGRIQLMPENVRNSKHTGESRVLKFTRSPSGEDGKEITMFRRFKGDLCLEGLACCALVSDSSSEEMMIGAFRPPVRLGRRTGWLSSSLSDTRIASPSEIFWNGLTLLGVIRTSVREMRLSWLTLRPSRSKVIISTSTIGEFGLNIAGFSKFDLFFLRPREGVLGMFATSAPKGRRADTMGAGLETFGETLYFLAGRTRCDDAGLERGDKGIALRLLLFLTGVRTTMGAFTARSGTTFC